MGERSEYAPGTFCWAELSTPDQEAAEAFYAALFGWQAQHLPMGESAYYSMQLIDGKPVAAIAAQPPQQRDAGVPPLWSSYISVDDADAVAGRAKSLGADVHAPPFDVFTAGRMAVIQDPQGAYFMLWQPREHIGAQLVNAPGALIWNTLQSPDIDASKAFYGDLFGWSFEELEGTPERYVTINNAGARNGGIGGLAPPSPPSWLAYFAVEDIHAALAKAGEQGGSTLVGPVHVPAGNVAVVADPQGAVFALHAAELAP